ncbi:DUF938 domain-containing protein [Kordiimonas pumila]|uniref:DUF938 domain-containing protein n=1 Tax=Kordiimonas pumila TaxID=2161677 RepID=A0ABV7D5P5_9PROT|nr:DUF938 domain-containing protein [Kordiimonas pumila]
MVRFFDPKATSENAAKRLHAPATERNREVIWDVLSNRLPKEGLIFEVASGTGEHAAFMAPKLSHHKWQPSDIDPRHLESINAWAQHVCADTVLPATRFDVLTDNFPDNPAAILAVNLVHISPWSVTEALIAKAGEALHSGAILYLYGPYKQNGAHTSESNIAFDQSLKFNNPEWGVRDMETVIGLAAKAGFMAPEILPMPANNFSLVFKHR